MIWNYVNNRPLGSIRKLSISSDSFREDCDEWFELESDRGVYNKIELQSVRSAIENVGYNLHDFMLTHAYNMIPDTKLREYFVVYMCLGTSPSAKFISYNTEEFKGMDDAGVNILYRARDISWGSRNSVSDFDIYCRYYFCETEEDVLDIFADGVGDVRQLSTYYHDQGQDIELKALQYVYGAENKYLKYTTGKSFYTCPQSVRDEILSVLKDYFLDGLDDSYDNNDVHSIFAAAINKVNKNNLPRWIEWARKPNERRDGRNNILPEIIDYLTDHPEEFDKPILLIDGSPHIIAPAVSPRTWEAVSESLIEQCLENVFGKRYDSIASIPKDEIVHLIAGIIGTDAAEKFADYIWRAKH